MVTMAFTGVSAQTYNNLWIPDTLSGTTFNLKLKDSSVQYLSGKATATSGINKDAFWGPTLFINKGDSVHMNVLNSMGDTTTIHWHGMHLAPVMDGGPHQPIPPSTLWQPYWKMMNNAATFWYHPHMHMMAVHQITSGLGGLLIVRDSLESSLKLPRTYGVDDIPLILTDRRFDNTNQFVDASYGDTMVTNGILSAETHLPAQVVRFRILNASLERAYNIGFSDNRKFYVITTDGGLVDKPVSVTRFVISSAERVEILVDLSKDKNSTLDLKAYNASLPKGVSGFEPANQPGPLSNKLGARNFNILHINVDTANANPITSIPATLTTNVFWNESNATATRKVTIADSIINGRPTFAFNHRIAFDLNHIDYSVKKDAYEIWEVSNTSVIAHPFHIHDIEFHILTRNGVAPTAEEQGWKDVVLVHQNETVRFIAKFDDFADSVHPFMFHCHIAAHEDAGLMGQFVVTQSGTSGIEKNAINANPVNVYPNPTDGNILVSMPENEKIKNIRLTNILGQLVPASWNSFSRNIDISSLPSGLYLLQITSTNGTNYYARVIRN